MPTEAKPAPKRVPSSITFGYKVLRIPTLQEMGIPMAGYGVCSLSENLCGLGYDPCWIDRGDPLVTYNFRFFRNDTRPFLAALLGDPFWNQTFEILSPISGLLLSTRPEQTVGFVTGLSLQYECCDEQRLPVILVPNDEPPPASTNFYEYDRIGRVLRDNFELIPIRDRSHTSPERLRDYMARHNERVVNGYRGHLNVLQNRNSDEHRTHDIREISATDTELIGRMQNLRGKDIYLREKLVHLARKYGEAI